MLLRGEKLNKREKKLIQVQIVCYMCNVGRPGIEPRLPL